nr:MAG TPA: hypothetical protein [Caudoviricetes sp.]
MLCCLAREPLNVCYYTGKARSCQALFQTFLQNPEKRRSFAEHFELKCQSNGAESSGR